MFCYEKLISDQGERFSETKERISKRTGIKGKQFDKIRFHMVGKSRFAVPELLEDGKLPSSTPFPGASFSFTLAVFEPWVVSSFFEC